MHLAVRKNVLFAMPSSFVDASHLFLVWLFEEILTGVFDWLDVMGFSGQHLEGSQLDLPNWSKIVLGKASEVFSLSIINLYKHGMTFPLYFLSMRQAR